MEGLNSCTKYIFEIYTTHNGARSKDKSVYRVETLPSQPTGLKMLNYDSDSVELSWDKNVDAAGYMLNVQPGTALFHLFFESLELKVENNRP